MTKSFNQFFLRTAVDTVPSFQRAKCLNYTLQQGLEPNDDDDDDETLGGRWPVARAREKCTAVKKDW